MGEGVVVTGRELHLGARCFDCVLYPVAAVSAVSATLNRDIRYNHLTRVLQDMFFQCSVCYRTCTFSGLCVTAAARLLDTTT